MTDQPILHKRTKLQIDSFLTSPSQALILSGDSGIGKNYIATWMADQLGLQVIQITVAEDKKMIGIEQVQQLYVQTRSSSSLCIIIDNSHLMTTDAQNAFLKLLEEPPANTYFVLSTTDSDLLLQTIRSRSQEIRVHTPSLVDVKTYVTKLRPDIEEATAISLINSTEAKPGLLTKLLVDEELLDAHKQSIIEAKQFLSGSPQDRLSLISQKGFEISWTTNMVDNLALILCALIQLSSKDKKTIDRLYKQSALIEETSEALAKSGNPKIHLTKLALEL